MYPLSLRLAACALALCASPLLHAQTSNDMVRIEARAKTDVERKDIKNATTDTVTQNRTVSIAISGKPKSPETRKGTWTVYGRSLEDRKLVVLESGDFNIELPTSGQQKLETKAVTSTYTNAHNVVKRNGDKRFGGVKSKRVDAEGTKHAGFSVVIKDGDKVVGEYYDPPGLKQEKDK